MEIKKLEGILEAVLFASGDAISLEKLCQITEVDAQTLTNVIMGLADRYNYEQRGIKIIRVGDKYQMATRGEYAGYVQQIVDAKKRNPLSKATLEVLAIVAYKQPITRSGIEHIRGVNCDNSISRLVELGLIEAADRLDAPGRPSLFSTTDEFLRSFGIDSIGALPVLQDFVMEELEEAEES